MGHRYVVGFAGEVGDDLVVADHGDDPRGPIRQRQRTVVEARAPAESDAGAVDGESRDDDRRCGTDCRRW